MPIEMVGEVGDEIREDLREALRHAYSSFRVYQRSFREAGISADDILNRDPVALLQRLPLMDERQLHKLADESILTAGQVIDMETSSGTTGPRKRRLITHRDDAAETTTLAELLALCGTGRSDRVACVDTGPLTLMVALTRALDSLGAESYAFCATPDDNATVDSLAVLDPTVIVTVPSILERCLGALERRFAKTPHPSLSKIIYVGEPLSERTRSRLTGQIGVEVFGYYGASETSAVGIECADHRGIHVLTDRNIIEIAVREPGGVEGEILVTTLHQEGLRLIRYGVRDIIAVKDGSCSCAAERYPRVEVLGRADGTASVLGVKVSHRTILDAAYPGTNGAGPMQVVLTRNGRDELTIVLPESLADDASRIRASLVSKEPDLAYLVSSGFLGLDLDFVDETYFQSQRKTPRIIDRRRGANV